MAWGPVFRSRFGVAAALVGSLCLSPTARADFFFHHWENQSAAASEFRLIPEAWIYTSSQNFNVSGATNSPTSLVSYDRLQVDTTLRYGLSKAWTVFGRFSWARVSVDSTPQLGSAFGLPDQTVGANWKIWENESGMSLHLQGQMDFAAYNNQAAQSSGTPFFGDGSMDFTGGALLSVFLDGAEKHSWALEGGVGYTFRTAGFSQAIPWSVAVRHDPGTQGLRLDVGAYGLTSLNTDRTAQPATPSKDGAGGSFVVNAINPSLVSAAVKVGYRFNERLSMTAGGVFPLFGIDAPSGTTVAFGMEFNWGPRVGHFDKRTLTPGEYGQSNAGFVNYAFEGHIARINDRLNMFKIDKGRLNGVEVGQTLDVFEVKKDGSVGEAIARAKVTSVKPDEAIMKVTEYYKEVWIEEGFVVKRPLE